MTYFSQLVNRLEFYLIIISINCLTWVLLYLLFQGDYWWTQNLKIHLVAGVKRQQLFALPLHLFYLTVFYDKSFKLVLIQYVWSRKTKWIQDKNFTVIIDNFVSNICNFLSGYKWNCEHRSYFCRLIVLYCQFASRKLGDTKD